jgi:hypothetical protein
MRCVPVPPRDRSSPVCRMTIIDCTQEHGAMYYPDIQLSRNLFFAVLVPAVLNPGALTVSVQHGCVQFPVGDEHFTNDEHGYTSTLGDWTPSIHTPVLKWLRRFAADGEFPRQHQTRFRSSDLYWIASAICFRNPWSDNAGIHMCSMDRQEFGTTGTQDLIPLETPGPALGRKAEAAILLRRGGCIYPGRDSQRLQDTPY